MFSRVLSAVLFTPYCVMFVFATFCQFLPSTFCSAYFVCLSAFFISSASCTALLAAVLSVPSVLCIVLLSHYADRVPVRSCAFVSRVTIEPRHEISNSEVCATSKTSDQPAHTRSLIRALASRLNIL